MTDTADIRASVDGVPVKITHGYEVATRPDRVPAPADGVRHRYIEYQYNFFDYHFGRDEQTIFARSYFGEPEVAIRSHARDLATWPLALRALIYLQLRYREIRLLTSGSGYEPLPRPLARRVMDGVDHYLDACGVNEGTRAS